MAAMKLRERGVHKNEHAVVRDIYWSNRLHVTKHTDIQPVDQSTFPGRGIYIAPCSVTKYTIISLSLVLCAVNPTVLTARGS
jgi:hypothetical protein